MFFAAHASAEPSASNRADALFERGKAEMTAGHTTAACVLFAESYAIDATEGTLLALGLCHEREDRLVDAFAELRDVHASAMKSGRDDRQRVARSALARIEPRIGRVVVRAETACAALMLDGRAVTKPDAELPVSPGDHHVTCKRAAAPWEGDVSVTAGALAVVVVPDATKPDATSSDATSSDATSSDALRVRPTSRIAPSTNASDGGPGRTLGWIAGAVGLASLGVGTVFGVRSFDRWGEVESRCPTPKACLDPAAKTYEDDARTSATVANITIVAGLALVGLGIYLIATHPTREARR